MCFGKLKSSVILCACALLLFQVMPAQAKSPAELASESEAYCKSTAKERPTSPQAIIDKVNAGSAVLAKEGTAAFPKFKGNGSPFLFEGTYIWVHNLKEGKMLMHPIKYKMEGNKYIGLKDKTGKRFFVIMNKVVKEKGSGWVSYMWPKPGSKGLVKKISYVKGVKSADGIDLVLGCGIYNGNQAELAKLEIH